MQRELVLAKNMCAPDGNCSPQIDTREKSRFQETPLKLQIESARVEGGIIAVSMPSPSIKTRPIVQLEALVFVTKLLNLSLQ